MGLPLVTIAEYKAYAGKTTPNEDTQIASLITIVSELVKTYCRRTFIDYADDAKVEVFSGKVQPFLLKEFPLIAISSVAFSSDYGVTYTDLVEGTDFYVDVEDNTINSVSTTGFTTYPNGYKVTYTAGYTTLPSDLKLGIFDLITYYLSNDQAVHSPKAPGTNSVQVEYITTSNLPAHIRRILELYKGDFA